MNLLALELRTALELYQARWQKPKNEANLRDLTKDFLNADDWTELQRFYNFLSPFYILTKTMEGNANKHGNEGGHGAVWETLKTMDWLFMKIKQAAEETRDEDDSHFKLGIDCGWLKLEEYYKLTDATPIYRAALALYPSYGYDYFDRHWRQKMNKPAWFTGMKAAVSDLWDEYRRQAEVEAQAQAGMVQVDEDNDLAINDYSSFGKRSINTLNRQRKRARGANELATFQERTITVEDLDVPNPLSWWHRHKAEYPILYSMAVDLFSIPGMSAECERVFSQTKKLITEERNRLSPDTVEADQLQKHWLLRGLVT